MSLRKIGVENYRCFREYQEIEIHPVTVVFGRNNSGKSALVRAPLVFSTGFGAETSAPLEIDRLANVGLDNIDSFVDLIFERVAVRPMRVSMEVSGSGSFTLDATLRYSTEINQALVSELRITDDAVSVTIGLEPPFIYEHWAASYLVEAPSGSFGSHLLEFRGLLPSAGMPKPLQGWLSRSRSLGPIRYLGSHRESLPRHHRLPFGTPRTLGAYGEGATALLAHDRARGRGELIDLVNMNLTEIVSGWEIDELPVGPLWETVLRPRGRSDLQINLVDGGTGVAQILPLLVQCALDQLNGTADEPVLQIVEEPEMHLHPDAHAGLADLYLRTAAAFGTSFLVETHSETMLLRLRRRIAEGQCAPDTVGIYIVEQDGGASTVRRVGIDEYGNLSDEWPEGYFSRDYHEVRAIAEAQLRRSARAA